MSRKAVKGIEAVPTGWSELVLVCRSCGDSGFGERGKDDLRHALKQHLRGTGHRGSVGVIEVDCLGVCPKHAVTVGLASRPGRLLVIPEGEAAGTVLDRLGLDFATLPAA